MKIACGSCAAKYTVSDDKIQGKAVKVKCRKCDAVIVVSPNGEVTTQGGTPLASEARYTVSVTDADQRSLTVKEIVAAYNDAVIDAETFVWTDGMGDWAALKDVDVLVDALHAAAEEELGSRDVAPPNIEAPPTDDELGRTMAMPDGGLPDFDAALAANRAAQAPLAAAVGGYPVAPAGGYAPAPAGGYTAAPAGGYAPAPVPAAAAFPAAAPTAQGHGFGGGRGTFAGGAGAGMFGRVATSSAIPSIASSVSTSEDDGNSAIFSLNTLTAKAATGPSKSAARNDEDSGLIDLRALAAGLGAPVNAVAASPMPGGGGLFSIAPLQPQGLPVAGPPVTTALVPEAKPGNKGLVMALGGAVLLLGGVVLFMALKKPEAVVATTTPTAVLTGVIPTAAPTQVPAGAATEAVAAVAPTTTAVPDAAGATAAIPAGGQPRGIVPQTRPVAAVPVAAVPVAGTPRPPVPVPATTKTNMGGCDPADLMCAMRAGAKKKPK